MVTEEEQVDTAVADTVAVEVSDTATTPRAYPGWGRAGYPSAYGPPVGYAPPAGYAPPVALAPRDEAAALKAETEYLAAALEEAKARLATLESDKDE